MFGTKSSISASAAGGWCTTRSMPSSRGSSVGVGDEHGDLDDHVPADVEPGHLEVDPDEPVGGRLRRSSPSTLTGRMRTGRGRPRSIPCGRGAKHRSPVRGSSCGRSSRRLGRRGARCGSAAASGSSPGSRWPSPASPIPSPTRGVPGALRRVGTPAPLRRGVRLRHLPAPRRACVGEVSLGSVQRGPFQSAFVGYWIDETTPARLHARGGRAHRCATRSRSCDLHRVEAAIVPRNAREPAGRRQARPARRGHVAAVPPDPRRLGGPRPVHDHRRGVGRRGERRQLERDIPRSSQGSAAAGRARLRQPCANDHAWRSSSIATAVSKSGCHGASRSVALTVAHARPGGTLGGPCRERHGGVDERVVGDASPREPESRPPAGPSTRSPNSTIARRGLGPDGALEQPEWPPPGCRPMRAKRASKRARCARDAGRRSTSARLKPAPTAARSTAAIVGSGRRGTRGSRRRC